MRNSPLIVALFLVLCCAVGAHAQITLLNPSCTGTNSACFCTGGEECTTSGIDMTGATLWVVTSAYAGGAGIVLTSSPACPNPGGWQQLTPYNYMGLDQFVQVSYCYAPTNSTGVTITCGHMPGGDYPTCFLHGYSGTATNSCVYDTENGTGLNTSGPFQPGPITPASVNELIVSVIGSQGSFSSASINDSFTVLGQEPSSANTAGADAYLIDSSNTSINPTWTLSGYGYTYTEIAQAAFKATAACGGARHFAVAIGPN